MLIRGAPGSGKSVTALDLATSLDGGASACASSPAFASRRARIIWSKASSAAPSARRSLFSTIVISIPIGWRAWSSGSAPRRATDLSASCSRRKACRVTTLVAVGAGATLIETLEAAEQIIDLTPEAELFSAIVARRHPEWGAVARKHIERLLSLTARDLVLLDELLRTLDWPSGIPQLTIDDLYHRVLRRYFRDPQNSSWDRDWPHAPTLKRLAAIGQFDVAIPKREVGEPGRGPAIPVRLSAFWCRPGHHRPTRSCTLRWQS